MKVLFFQPKHFNRTAQKTNPFFDPIIRVCEDHGVPYRIYQPYRHPDTGYRKVYSSQYLRKFVRFFKWIVLPFAKNCPECELERKAGVLWNVLTFGFYRADIYITVAAELAAVLPGINPKARIVDVQHGIIYSSHAGYFDCDGRLMDFLKMCYQREFWVYGKGFADQFFTNAENAKELGDRVHVVGDILGHKECSIVNNEENQKSLLVSLQLTSECTQCENDDMYQRTVAFLRGISTNGLWNGFPILLKHHPRYNNCFDISSLIKEFTQVQFVTDDWGVISKKICVNATLDSTVAFDLAAYGIPTYFIGSDMEESTSCADIWRSDFKYPYWGMSFDRIANLMAEQHDETKVVLNRWFSDYYGIFNPDRIGELLKRK